MANLFRRLNPTRALNGLWRHGDFVRLWSSLTITHFGGQITFLALPLTGALLLDATPLEMGFLTALEALPFALFGLFAGVLVDRANGSAASAVGKPISSGVASSSRAPVSGSARKVI